ncbi:MAG: hypothetical protein M3Z85_01890 [Acidobacteriota bacterium]|nr:hypothetical protein [Acidobacteriota bacterium]
MEDEEDRWRKNAEYYDYRCIACRGVLSEGEYDAFTNLCSGCNNIVNGTE